MYNLSMPCVGSRPTITLDYRTAFRRDRTVSSTETTSETIKPLVLYSPRADIVVLFLHPLDAYIRRRGVTTARSMPRFQFRAARDRQYGTDPFGTRNGRRES